MDPVTLTFYAIVCGLLSFFARPLENGAMRFGAGVVVGLVAAGLLPSLRGLVGL